MTHEVKLIATATLLAGGTHVLLVKYNDMPDQQRGWFLPHDLLGKLEHPADAVARALREQLALEAPALRLGHVESFKGRDGTWHMPLHFLAEFAERPQIKPSAALAAADWFALDKLPPRSEVGHHGWAIDTIAAVRTTPA
jgi:ADP-ribose pyrophosphatase YjhB (NUDIX family)